MNGSIEYETGNAPVSPGPPGAGRPWQAAGPPPGTKSGIPTWAIVLILIGTVLVALCCGITGVGAVLGDDDPEKTGSTVAAQEVESPTPSPEPTEQPTPDPTEEPTSGPLDRLPDYWAAYGCENFACILDAGEPGMRPWWVRSIEEHSTYAAVRVDPEADPVWACRNVKGLLYPGDNFRVEVYDGTGTRQLAVYSAWSGKCVLR